MPPKKKELWDYYEYLHVSKLSNLEEMEIESVIKASKRRAQD